MPLDASIDDLTRLYLGRLNGFQGCVRSRPGLSMSCRPGLPLSARQTRLSASCARGAMLSVPFGYQHPDHDTYAFHITFAYPIRRLDDKSASQWQDVFDDCLSLLPRQAPVIELRPPVRRLPGCGR
ncbi:hypothetical protein [Mesorhizobium sp.]|uniref:hypothetical protein n=1 Tax=Mesorhizobium sp. TaxID=1871066 RepID=UPI00257A85C4|nr:hypothetical protein [Mesorhizobium sp.]